MRSWLTVLLAAAAMLTGACSRTDPRPQTAGAAALPKEEYKVTETGTVLTAYGQELEARTPATKTETATFAAGCFWGVEERFRQVPGVVATMVGFTGGHAEKASYKQVCTDTTGHAEAVQVEFDPSRVSYEQLLDVFWNNHNPTTRNRQGPDVGSQYRSAIFYYSPEQKAAAEASKARLAASEKYAGRTIVTEIVPAGPFWRAEDYHQQYLAKRGMSQCHVGGD